MFKASMLVLSLLLPLITSSKSPTLLDHTATAALKDARNQSNSIKFEYGGIIFKRNSTLQYSYPITIHKTDAVTIDPQALMMPGDILVGLYHTHPCMPVTHFTNLLSVADVIMTYFWHVPQFMLDECTGLVHTYNPDTDHIKDTCKVVEANINGIDKLVCLPVGNIVGNIHQTSPSQDTPRPIIPF